VLFCDADMGVGPGRFSLPAARDGDCGDRELWSGGVEVIGADDGGEVVGSVVRW
jgi:hypothetical protein